MIKIIFHEYSVEKDKYNYTINYLDRQFYDYGRTTINRNIAPIIWDDIANAIESTDDLNSKQGIVASFLKDYSDKHILAISLSQSAISKYWKTIETDYFVEAAKFFDLDDYDSRPISVYLTTLNRCPYHIQQRFFFIPFSAGLPRQSIVVMHELFHFLFLGKYESYLQQCNMSHNDIMDINESFVCMLNVLFRDTLMIPEQDNKPSAEPLKERIIKMHSRNAPFRDILDDLISYKKTTNLNS